MMIYIIDYYNYGIRVVVCIVPGVNIIPNLQGGVPPKTSEKVFFEGRLSIFAVSC